MNKIKENIKLHFSRLDTDDKIFYLSSLIQFIICLPLALWGNQMKQSILKPYLGFTASLLIVMLLASIIYAWLSETKEPKSRSDFNL